MKTAKLFEILIIAAVVAVCGLWVYDFASSQGSDHKFVLYSGVINDFAILDNKSDNARYSDASGNIYTESKYDSILVTFHYRQLYADERMPDSLFGVPVSMKFMQTESFTFRSTPSEINKITVPLYFLLESMSGRVDLSMPDDVFRITKSGIEFIDMDHGLIKKEKSRIFTDIMNKKKFAYPAVLVAGNGTNKKDYDNGYLIVDSENKLYNLKMQCGRPYLRQITMPNGLVPQNIFVTEHKGRHTLGYIISKEGEFYILETGSYNFVKAELPPINAKEMSVSIIGNYFDWTVTITESDKKSVYALNAKDYKFIKKFDF